jgi:hypothetical protein
MSIFGLYFVGGLLREAGWPRTEGFFKKEVLNTTILDGVIDQMITWSAALGAGRPRLALQVLASMFRDRDWTSDNAPNIKLFIEGAKREKESWNVSTVVAPHEVVQPTRFATTGPTLPAKALKDDRFRLALEQWCLEGLLWGLGNPGLFRTWYQSAVEEHERNLPFMRQSGLAVDPMPKSGAIPFGHRRDTPKVRRRRGTAPGNS